MFLLKPYANVSKFLVAEKIKSLPIISISEKKIRKIDMEKKISFKIFFFTFIFTN